MSVFSRLFLGLAALFLVLATQSNSFASGSELAQVEHYTSSKAGDFDVKYFAHNGPSLNEFLEGKERVSAILSKIADYGFKANFLYLDIGIAPQRMNGGDVVKENGNIYISITATNSEIEGALLGLFTYHTADCEVTFFAHNSATLEQFDEGKAKIESAVQRFKENGLELVFPVSPVVGIASGRMNGGLIVEENGKVYISTTTPENLIERYLMKYVRNW